MEDLNTKYIVDNHSDLLNALEKLKELSDQYYSNVLDIYTLEAFKREFLAYLQYYTEAVASVKSYKAGQSGYLEEERKRIKAEVLELMIAEGAKKTNAELLVYNDKRYREKLALVNQLRTFFIKTEDLLRHFNRVLDSVVQSISVAGKERI